MRIFLRLLESAKRLALALMFRTLRADLRSVVPNETKYIAWAMVFILTSNLTFKEARPRFTLCDKSFLFIFLFVLCSQSLGLDHRCSGERFLVDSA